LLNSLNKEIKHGLITGYLESLSIGKNTSKLETRNAKANYFKDRLSQNFHNPKQFRNQLSNLLNKTKKSLIKNIKFNSEIISDPLLISQAFNQHFFLYM